MSGSEHGLEILRKSGEQVSPGDNREYYLKVKNPDGQPLDFSGEFVFAGLSQAIKVTTMEVMDTPTLIPSLALMDRNSISIQNKSSTEILFLGPFSVEANSTIGGNGGWEVPPQEAFNFDVKNVIPVYGIAPSGKTIIVKVLEMA